MTTENLKPLNCPFCHSDKITIEWEPCPPLDKGDTNRRWFAECSQCSCQGPFCQKEPEVIKAWNTRTPSHVAQRIEACAKEIEHYFYLFGKVPKHSDLAIKSLLTKHFSDQPEGECSNE